MNLNVFLKYIQTKNLKLNNQLQSQESQANVTEQKEIPHTVIRIKCCTVNRQSSICSIVQRSYTQQPKSCEASIAEVIFTTSPKRDSAANYHRTEI